MSIRKRNEYLDAGTSDEDGGPDSDREAAADSRTAGLVSRKPKRRKLTTTESDSEHGSILSEPENTAAAVATNKQDESPPTSSLSPEYAPGNLLEKPNPSTTKRTLAARASKSSHKAGVVYLSRIPPFMRPSTVKSLLSTHGLISKIFLTPEPPSNYLRRKKAGGNKKHSFIDGWVEFDRKKHAKQCVDAINGQIVGGKKGGWYRDDVWNARYLRGFSWSDLMQSVRAEEREREERVRVGTKRATRERGEFLKNLERSKVEETRKEKRRRKEESQPGENKTGHDLGRDDRDCIGHQEPQEVSKGGGKKSFERRFRQNEVKQNGSRQSDQSDDVKRVLSKIF